MFDVGYKINKDLFEEIVSQVPDDLSKIEKAVFIYEKLCLKLQYSIGYYIEEHLLRSEEHKFQDFFKQARNLQIVDGDVIDDVVCFTFNAIFLYFLVSQDLIDKQTYDVNCPLRWDRKTLITVHQPLDLEIDGIRLQIDATLGILDNNDLTLIKYGNYQINGWKTFSANDEKIVLKAIKKVPEHNWKARRKGFVSFCCGKRTSSEFEF